MSARHDRQIEIGTPDDTHKPFFYKFDVSSRYKDENLLQLGIMMSKTTGYSCRIARVIDVPNFCRHT